MREARLPWAPFHVPGDDLTDKTITRLISELQTGDEEAARGIWEHFFDRICRYARKQVGLGGRRSRDEEDLAASALYALYEGVRCGRFDRLDSRHDFWALLARITSNKAASHHRRLKRQKELGESVIQDQLGEGGLAEIAEGSPTPVFMESLTLTCQEMLELLDENTRTVAMLKLEGYSNEDVAERIGRSLRSVERYLFVIRSIWREGN